MKQWLGAVVLAGVMAVPGLVFAEDAPTFDPVQHDVERLKSLQATDPAAYEEAIAVRQAELRRRLAALKERNPAAHDRLVGSIREHRRLAAKREFEDLTRLAQTDPEAFRQRIEARQRRIARRLDRVSPEQLERVYGAAAQQGISSETLGRVKELRELRRIRTPSPGKGSNLQPDGSDRRPNPHNVSRPQRSFDNVVDPNDPNDPRARRRLQQIQRSGGSSRGGSSSGGGR